MALKITLKPGEKMIIGGAVVTNGNSACRLTVENKVPLLRQKDIMAEREALTPCRRIYFTVQLMYIDPENLVHHHELYWRLSQEVVAAAPSSLELIKTISAHILGGDYYRALKAAQKLIEFEQEVTSRV